MNLSSKPVPWRSVVRRWALILAGWTLIVLVFAAQAYVFALSRNRPDSFHKEFLAAASDWYVWAALTPVVLWICRRFRISAQNWATRIPIHLLASIALSFLQLLIQVRLNYWINPGYTLGFGKVLYFFATYKFHFNLLSYWVIVALNHGFYYFEQSRNKELARSQMETELAHAQLQVLNMQLHPHFLFNTLHAIATLIPDDPQAAEEMVLKLSDLLRASLGKLEQHEVPLQQELELLDCYLSIEQTRFKDRLKIRKEIDSSALNCAVPTMILQPLVENAIRHGIGKHRQADEISILARNCSENGDQHLRLEVRNCAGKIDSNGEGSGRGIGLSNTVARLQQLYGDAHSFQISNRPEGGVAVVITLPASAGGATEPAEPTEPKDGPSA